MQYRVTTFYQFNKIPDHLIGEMTQELTEAAERFSVCGLIILATEGINATVAAPEDQIDNFKNFLRSYSGLENMIFKDSTSDKKPFRRFKIKIRDEIVTAGRSDLFPAGPNNHLPPEEWHRILTEEEDFVLIDTRNWYETAVGKFRGAIDPGLEMFTEFSDYVKKSGIPQDKKVLMYCTGGIRCEKASLEMASQGYRKVYQLEGGILNYLQKYPAGEFEGECFVFDHRVAVNSDLRPSDRFALCPHCGNPGDQQIICEYCDSDSTICKSCIEEDLKTCSKNCQHHYVRGTRKPRTRRVTAE